MSEKLILIRAGDVEVRARLLDTKTAQGVWNALPVEAETSIWGDEIYFSIPVNLSSEDGKDVVSLGDLGYWPPGTAFCVFFGKTPVSRGDEIRPASAVNVFGKVEGDAAVFKKVRPGQKITVEKVSQ